MRTLHIIVSTLLLSILFYSCDKNEYAPVIVEQNFTVSESTSEGASFGTVVATDADVGQRLSYEITDGNLDKVFNIEGSTGSLRVNDSDKLDYESSTHYVLLVVVSDNHKNDPLESSARIYIDVTDANEFAPLMPPGLEDQDFSVSENSSSGTLIGLVQATDADSEQELTYRISAGNESEIFGIDPVTGLISVADATQLDYESDTVHWIVVTAADSHEDDPLESSAEIQIDVVDENEYAPTIESQTFELDENPLVGQEIGLILASDEDSYQSLTYAIVGENEDNYFQINSQTGSLSVADSAGFDYEMQNQLKVLVEVSDSHINAMTAQAYITVSLKNVLELTEGLLAHYPFNGSANDESGNGMHGELNGPTLTTDRHENPSSAYLFDGVNDYINLTNSDALHFKNQDFSISLWYKYNSLDIKPQDIISVYSSGGNEREFRLASNPVSEFMYFALFDNGGSSYDKIQMEKNLGWQHITITKSASTLTVYLNGTLFSDKPVTANVKLTIARAMIGAVDKSTTSPDSFFDGKIDDIYIHSRVLEDWEITNLFQML